MSFFKGLFGGSAPKQPVLTPNKGMDQLEENILMLEKRISHLQNQIHEQEQIARTFATTNKTKALAALKRKKTLEENIRKAEGTLDTLQGQKDLLEGAATNAALIKTISDTTKIIKGETNNLNLDQVENIVDEMREQKEVSEEISNILSQTTRPQVDEDELLKELESMQEEQINEKLLQTDKDTTSKLPDVPSQLPAQASSSKKPEDELDELKKWASAAQ